MAIFGDGILVDAAESDISDSELLAACHALEARHERQSLPKENTCSSVDVPDSVRGGVPLGTNAPAGLSSSQPSEPDTFRHEAFVDKQTLGQHVDDPQTAVAEAVASSSVQRERTESDVARCGERPISAARVDISPAETRGQDMAREERLKQIDALREVARPDAPPQPIGLISAGDDEDPNPVTMLSPRRAAVFLRSREVDEQLGPRASVPSCKKECPEIKDTADAASGSAKRCADVPKTTECPICMDAPVDSAFDPCGHVTCANCSALFKRKPCPVCRKKVKKAIRFYLP